jgi:hypothetical protein
MLSNAEKCFPLTGKIHSAALPPRGIRKRLLYFLSGWKKTRSLEMLFPRVTNHSIRFYFLINDKQFCHSRWKSSGDTKTIKKKEKHYIELK